MANASRSERQLMRQRGAGMRNAKDVDFGLNFGAKGSREDRQLMRQRGAGNRKIEHVDFGFSFPTPINPRRSSSRLSRGDRRSVERPSKTPSARKERQSSIARSNRAASTESHGLPPTQSLTGTPEPISRPEQPNSSKRRRLSKYAPIQIAIDAAEPSHPLPQNSPNHRVASIIEAPETEETILNGATSSPQNAAMTVGAGSRSESPLFVPENDDKENTDINATYKSTEPFTKQRRSMLHSPVYSAQTPLAQVKRSRVIQRAEGDGPESTIVTKQTHVANGLGMLDAAILDLQDNTESYSFVEPNVSTTKKRKKRKPVILVKKRRRSSDMRRESSLQTTHETASQDQSIHADIAGGRAEDEASASERDDATAGSSRVSLLPTLARVSKRIPGRRNRLSVSTSPAPRGGDNEEEDETYVQEEGSPEPVTPAPPRRGRPPKTKKGEQKAGSDLERKQRTAKSSFPIQTHRMVNTEALPTITEESEEEVRHSDEEFSRMPTAFSDRAQPNPVDVLAQICRETIQSALDKLDTNTGAPVSRAEARRKRTALEAFASGLDQRLFDMSEAVENRMTLEARVRKSKRELAELHARWVEVRRQRDEVALRADAIRRQNWENEEEGKRQWQISQLAHGTELELGNNVTDEDNLELLLKEVASKVSSTHGRLGMLDKVRSFNGQLERLAAALEKQ